MADRILEVQPNSTSLSSINSATETPSIADQIKLLSEQIAELRASHSRQFRCFSRRRSNSRTYRSNSNNRQSDNYCWYHNKFGHRARKCVSPCLFRNSKNNAPQMPENRQAEC
ncbi:unnamed protein product [Dicrocoelium dendriticum]|nr:unnamed protein product [Dicrocoelium dendriticum]CAI2737065.1 unnamed protein product [Dicrocoelium dendriticum]